MASNQPSRAIDRRPRLGRSDGELDVTRLLPPRAAACAIVAVAMGFAITVGAQQAAPGKTVSEAGPAAASTRADAGPSPSVTDPSTDRADGGGPSGAGTSVATPSAGGVSTGSAPASIPTFRPHAPPLPPPSPAKVQAYQELRSEAASFEH